MLLILALLLVVLLLLVEVLYDDELVGFVVFVGVVV